MWSRYGPLTTWGWIWSLLGVVALSAAAVCLGVYVETWLPLWAVISVTALAFVVAGYLIAGSGGDEDER